MSRDIAADVNNDGNARGRPKFFAQLDNRAIELTDRSVGKGGNVIAAILERDGDRPSRECAGRQRRERAIDGVANDQRDPSRRG